MGIGATITVILDIVLIPRYGAVGGAVTSAVTYLTTTMVLVLLARRQFTATRREPEPGISRAPRIVAGDSWQRRAVDVLVAGIALAIMWPLLFAVAAAVRLTSSGPALYRQIRTGRSGEPFTILKFRSMISGADLAGPLITTHADSRVTSIGAFLRVTKLDELPQLINVLRGDMTLIGPRPEVPRFIPCYYDEELETLRVRPGMTGAGQIIYSVAEQVEVAPASDPEQRYVTCELHPKLAIDLDYLRRRSLRFDLTILGRTMLLVTRLGKRLPLLGP
jgi:lipopolysaccharide/colanic/teichoic acid biosynthesis glycosyltransferase